MAVTQQLDRPPLAEPRSGNSLNPFSAGEVSVNAGSGLVAVEQQRAIAEVQARMIIARANPRDPIRAMEKILNACTRPTLAERAAYQFARGGSDIRGPSIRLAEAIAQSWGNLASGIKEIARHGEFSECVAYAWDLETGFYDERQFQVRHWRDTKRGGYQLTDERDIYELIANFGQRRKRAVLLTVIPGDVAEAALEQCERTLHARADTSPEGIRRLVEAFAEFGVTPGQIETRIQRRLEAIRPAQIVSLKSVYNSLRDGMSNVEDWFEPIGTDLVETPAGEPTDAADPPPRRRGRPPKTATAPVAPDVAAEKDPAPTRGETFYGDQDERPAPPARPPLQFDV